MKQIDPREKKLIEKNLKRYLEEKLPFSELCDSLKGVLTFDFSNAPGQRKISDNHIDNDIEFQVKPEHLKVMLQKYIEGETPALVLSNWAAFVFMMPNYIPEGKTEDERWQAGESALWVVLQELGTPDIFGGLDIPRAREYLDQLY